MRATQRSLSSYEYSFQLVIQILFGIYTFDFSGNINMDIGIPRSVSAFASLCFEHSEKLLAVKL